ncbi:MAG: hypothetical protein CME69_06310 [Halobacteriovorax sp.]|nr:hypothetical protein [Halobacteriovorax sp.]
MKLILLLISLIQISILARGHDRGNGGQSIYIGDNAFLRDIVEDNNCLWRSGSKVINDYPNIEKVLTKIESYHWLLGLRLEEEIKGLKFCFTKKRLPPLSYNNSDDLYIFTNQMFDQPAINDAGIVFLDMNIFDDMNDVHKSFIIIHESLHEFFDKEEDRSSREPRLREFVYNLHDSYINGSDKESIKIAIEMARMAYLSSSIAGLDKSDYLLVINNKDLKFYKKLNLVEKFNDIKLYSKSFNESFEKLLASMAKVEFWGPDNVRNYFNILIRKDITTDGSKLIGASALDALVFERLIEMTLEGKSVDGDISSVVEYFNTLNIENFLHFKTVEKFISEILKLNYNGERNRFDLGSLLMKTQGDNNISHEIVKILNLRSRYFSRNTNYLSEAKKLLLVILTRIRESLKSSVDIILPIYKNFISNTIEFKDEKELLFKAFPELWNHFSLSYLFGGEVFSSKSFGLEELIKYDTDLFLNNFKDMLPNILVVKAFRESRVGMGLPSNRANRYIFSLSKSISYEKMIDIFLKHLNKEERIRAKSILKNYLSNLDLDDVLYSGRHSKKKFKTFINYRLLELERL